MLEVQLVPWLYVVSVQVHGSQTFSFDMEAVCLTVTRKCSTVLIFSQSAKHSVSRVVIAGLHITTHKHPYAHSLFLVVLRAARLVVLSNWLLWSSMLGSKAGLTRPGSSARRATVAELLLSFGRAAMVSSDVLSVHSLSCERRFLSAESP